MSEPCLTPGIKWHIEIHRTKIIVQATSKKSIVYALGALQAKELENDLHDAVELVIARHINKGGSSPELLIHQAADLLERDKLATKAPS